MLISATAAGRVASLPLSRLRALREGGATLVLEPELDRGVEPREVGPGDSEEPEAWPVVNVTMLGPEDDEGGPTSYYHGEVEGITQVAQLMHNIAAGQEPNKGLDNVPKGKRAFEFEG